MRLDAIIERDASGSAIGQQGPRSSRHSIERFEDHHQSVSDPAVFSAIVLDRQIDANLRIMKQTMHTARANGENAVQVESFLFLNSGRWVDPVSGVTTQVMCGHMALVLRVKNWRRCIFAKNQPGCAEEEEGTDLEVRLRMRDGERWAAQRAPQATGHLSPGYSFATDAGVDNRIIPGNRYLAAGTASNQSTFKRFPHLDLPGEECLLRSVDSQRINANGDLHHTAATAQECGSIQRQSQCVANRRCMFYDRCGCIPRDCFCGDTCCINGACGGLSAGSTSRTQRECEIFQVTFRREAPDQIMSVRFPLSHKEGFNTFLHSTLFW